MYIFHPRKNNPATLFNLCWSHNQGRGAEDGRLYVYIYSVGQMDNSPDYIYVTSDTIFIVFLHVSDHFEIFFFILWDPD